MSEENGGDHLTIGVQTPDALPEPVLTIPSKLLSPIRIGKFYYYNLKLSY